MPEALIGRQSRLPRAIIDVLKHNDTFFLLRYDHDHINEAVQCHLVLLHHGNGVWRIVHLLIRFIYVSYQPGAQDLNNFPTAGEN